MAEVLGLVASGITIVEVVGKVGSRILALKRLWDEVQDVPDKTTGLMRDIEVLEPLLTELERNLADMETFGSNSGSMRIALTYCQKAMANLDVLLEDLTINLKSSRKPSRGKAKLKVVLKKDVLDRSRDRLDMAMRLLGLAQQLYILYMPELIIRRLQSIDSSSYRQLGESSLAPNDQGNQKSAVMVHSYSSSRNTVTRGKPFNSARWSSNYFGSLALQYSQYDGEFNEKCIKLNARIQIPRWLARKVWEMQMSKSTFGWNFNLKTYHIVPDDSKVFKCALSGDINGVRQLFIDKQASIHDRDEWGRSLLWFAASGANVDLMNLLIAWGLDVVERTVMVDTTALYVCLSAMPKSPHADRIQDFLLVNNAYDNDGPLLPSMASQSFFDFTLRHTFTETLMFKTTQPLFQPHHYELPVKDRLQCLNLDLMWCKKPNAQTLRYILRKDGVLRQEDVSELQRDGIALLNTVAYYYRCAEKNNDEAYSKWRELCREVIRITDYMSFKQEYIKLDPHRWSRFPSGTPLAAVMMGQNRPFECVSKLTSALNLHLQNWLEDLEACCVDLQKYGLAEKQIFLENKWFEERWYPDWWWRPYSWCLGLKVRLIDFDYGSTPNNWIFHWDMDAERYAGQFWNSIENPTLQIPGSWVDEERNSYYSNSDYDSHDGDGDKS